MTSPFEKATAIQVIDDSPGSFRAAIPEGWQQGKGAFGGVAIGILARAIVASEGDRSRRLRSLSADLCAPAMVGPAEVVVTTLRRGASMSFLDARLLQNGILVGRASAALASARDLPPAVFPVSAPVRAPWADVPANPVEPPFGPVFAAHYEYRSTGPMPFGGGGEPLALGHLREKVSPSVIDEAGIVGMLDAWWPTSRALEEPPRAVATVGYTMQLLVDPRGLAPEEPLFYRGRGVASADNYFVEMRELWSGDQVVAMNQQTFALLT